jgi:hypothetical protein
MALSAERDTKQRAGTPLSTVGNQPVKASVKLYKGGIAVLNAGYLAPGTAATGLIAVGRSRETVDNSSGSNGDLKGEYEPGIFKWANSAAGDAIAQADVGKVCYIVDDQTVAKTDGTGSRSAAGLIAGIDSDGVWVQMGLGIGS